MTTYLKLADIRFALAVMKGRPVSRQLADEYTKRRDFPPPTIPAPIRLWEAEAIHIWMTAHGHLSEES